MVFPPHRVFLFIKYLLFSLLHIVYGETSLENIYARFKVIMTDKLDNYNLNDLEQINTDIVMKDLTDLQIRLVVHLEKLNMTLENKKIVVEFIKNWSNDFFYVQLIRLKTGQISEKEFIKQVAFNIQGRAKELLKILGQQKEIDEETYRIIEALQLLVFACEYADRFESLQVIGSVLKHLMEIGENLAAFGRETTRILENFNQTVNGIFNPQSESARENCDIGCDIGIDVDMEMYTGE